MKHQPLKNNTSEIDPVKTVSSLLDEIEGLQEKLEIERGQRREMEKSIYKNKKIDHVIFNNIHEAIIHLNRDGVIEKINNTVFDIFGLTSLEMEGKNLSEYSFLGPDYMQAIELYKAAAPDTAFPIFEIEAFHKDKSKIYIETQAQPIINNGKVEGIINIIRDITPQKKLENAKTATIMGMAKLAETRDDSTGQHLERIQEYVKVITLAISRQPQYTDYITPVYIDDIYHSSSLHDIGKIGIPDAILLKPGRLTKDEFEIIKQHTTIGGNALDVVDNEMQARSFLTMGRRIAYHHHECWDGSGYPSGLKGEAIPLSARIVSLADVYDALTSKRPYKEPYSHNKAVKIILDQRGSKFAPDVVDAFETELNKFDTIRCQLNDISAAA